MADQGMRIFQHFEFRCPFSLIEEWSWLRQGNSYKAEAMDQCGLKSKLEAERDSRDFILVKITGDQLFQMKSVQRAEYNIVKTHSISDSPSKKTPRKKRVAFEDQRDVIEIEDDVIEILDDEDRPQRNRSRPRNHHNASFQNNVHNVGGPRIVSVHSPSRPNPASFNVQYQGGRGSPNRFMRPNNQRPINPGVRVRSPRNAAMPGTMMNNGGRPVFNQFRNVQPTRNRFSYVRNIFPGGNNRFGLNTTNGNNVRSQIPANPMFPVTPNIPPNPMNTAQPSNTLQQQQNTMGSVLNPDPNQQQFAGFGSVTNPMNLGNQNAARNASEQSLSSSVRDAVQSVVNNQNVPLMNVQPETGSSGTVSNTLSDTIIIDDQNPQTDTAQPPQDAQPDYVSPSLGSGNKPVPVSVYRSSDIITGAEIHAPLPADRAVSQVAAESRSQSGSPDVQVVAVNYPKRQNTTDPSIPPQDLVAEISRAVDIVTSGTNTGGLPNSQQMQVVDVVDISQPVGAEASQTSLGSFTTNAQVIHPVYAGMQYGHKRQELVCHVCKRSFQYPMSYQKHLFNMHNISTNVLGYTTIPPPLTVNSQLPSHTTLTSSQTSNQTVVSNSQRMPTPSQPSESQQGSTSMAQVVSTTLNLDQPTVDPQTTESVINVTLHFCSQCSTPFQSVEQLTSHQVEMHGRQPSINDGSEAVAEEMDILSSLFTDNQSVASTDGYQGSPPNLEEPPSLLDSILSKRNANEAGNKDVNRQSPPLLSREASRESAAVTGRTTVSTVTTVSDSASINQMTKPVSENHATITTSVPDQNTGCSASPVTAGSSNLQDMDSSANKESAVFRCDKCDKHFNSRTLYNRHYKLSHLGGRSPAPDVQSDPPGVPQENHNFEESFIHHIQKTHGIEIRKTTDDRASPQGSLCQVCDEMFENPSLYIQHVQNKHKDLIVESGCDEKQSASVTRKRSSAEADCLSAEISLSEGKKVRICTTIRRRQSSQDGVPMYQLVSPENECGDKLLRSHRVVKRRGSSTDSQSSNLSVNGTKTTSSRTHRATSDNSRSSASDGLPDIPILPSATADNSVNHSVSEHGNSQQFPESHGTDAAMSAAEDYDFSDIPSPPSSPEYLPDNRKRTKRSTTRKRRQSAKLSCPHCQRVFHYQTSYMKHLSMHSVGPDGDSQGATELGKTTTPASTSDYFSNDNGSDYQGNSRTVSSESQSPQ